MSKRQVLPALLLVVGAAMLAAAVGVGTAGSATNRVTVGHALKGGTLKVNQANADFDYVDPQLAYRTDDWTCSFPTSMQLVSFREKAGAAGSQLYPEAATAFPSVSSDGKTYTFHIRPGLKFSDGSPVTAAAFQRSWERILSPKMGSPLGVNLDLQHVVAGGEALPRRQDAAHLRHHCERQHDLVPPRQAERHVRLDPVDAVVHGRQARHAVLDVRAHELSGGGAVLHRLARPGPLDGAEAEPVLQG